MVEFVVRPPEGTPPDAALFLAGDADELGRWRADGVRLAAWGDGTHRASLPLAVPVKYLVTRGRWREVESAGGVEMRPRELTPRPGLTVDVNVGGWGRDSVRYHLDFASQFVPQRRRIAVALPPGYDFDIDRRYPVFYLQDGQNLFDPSTAFAGNAWHGDDAAERLARAGDIRPVILVGVGNTSDRLHEYGPRRAPPGGVGLAKRYARFLADELKPFIDANYRTQPGPADTAIGGSSMGGLISLHLCRWLPHVFGNCAAMSPSLWWDRERFVRTAMSRPAWRKQCRIWLDMGGREGHTEAGMLGNVERARRLAGLLAGPELRYEEFPNAGHNETAWGERFDRVVLFLFGVQ